MSTPKYNNFGIYHYEHGPVVISGRFTTQAGPDVDDQHGHGYVVTYVGVGDYLLTFTDGFSDFIGGGTSMQCAQTVNMRSAFGTFTAGVAGACTLQITTATDDTDPAVAAECAVGDYVTFTVMLHTEFEP